MDIGVIAAITVFATVFFLILGVSATASAGGAMARSRLDLIKRQPDAEPVSAMPSFNARVAGPLVKGATTALGNLLPKSLLSGVEKQLITAGEPMTMTGFLTMVIVSTAASTGFGLMIVIAAGAKIGLTQLGVLCGVSLVGFVLPFWIVRSRAAQRQGAIIKSLADAFDLITTCVEAGLGLDAALARVAEKVEGPFAQELSRALRDIALGKPRREAMKELGARTGVADLVQFTNAVNQAEAMGSSIGAVLRVQADQLRIRRRQRAEEQAYKAPVKMIFPLVLCIFPTLFVVILGPAAITFMQGIPK